MDSTTDSKTVYEIPMTAAIDAKVAAGGEPELSAEEVEAIAGHPVGRRTVVAPQARIGVEALSNPPKVYLDMAGDDVTSESSPRYEWTFLTSHDARAIASALLIAADEVDSKVVDAETPTDALAFPSSFPMTFEQAE